MFHIPGNYRDVSLALSQVLEDIGLNERIMTRRRRTALLMETMATLRSKLEGQLLSLHVFGSRAEGTTTPGLHSDTDILFCHHGINVIENCSEWKPGVLNLRMYREEDTPPGYCMLQELYRDVPLPLTEPRSKHHIKNKEDVVLLKSTFYDHLKLKGAHKDGAAITCKSDGFYDHDFVNAFPCSSSSQLMRWMERQVSRGKITEVMKQYIESNHCYVIPVGHKCSDLEELEWRISTSHAEMCIMFHLNVTQLQCYVLMKLFVKSHLQYPGEKALTSYMCKNVLLQCIEKTESRLWVPINLLTMFLFCLSHLQRFISQEYCPHFVIRDNNLMKGKFSAPAIQSWLLASIRDAIPSLVSIFLNLETDDIGKRLRSKMYIDHVLMYNNSSVETVSRTISGVLVSEVAKAVMNCHKIALSSNPYDSLITLLQMYYRGRRIDRLVCILLKPLLYSNIACTLASCSIQQNGTVCDVALPWLNASLNSDVASSRLKLASVYLSIGNFVSAEIVLRGIEEKYDLNVVTASCGCHDVHGISWRTDRFAEYADSHNELSLVNVVALCVRFSRSEIGCVPRELQYEMFRSTPEEQQLRTADDCWMDWAVVDSLPYLYFLQYKTYGHLHRYADQQRALDKLITIVQQTKKNFGHRDTAWNLLGQCMEQENRHNDALVCYMSSLNIRPNNNAAIIHICMLLNRTING